MLDQIAHTAKKFNKHILDNLNYVDVDYQWEVGDILVCDRTRWHISNNFSKFNKTKNVLVLFMAGIAWI